MKLVRISLFILALSLSACKLNQNVDGVDGSGSTNPNPNSGTINLAPSAVSNIDDGLFFNKSNESPSISWTASSDSDGSISHYLVAVGSTSGGHDVLDWTQITSTNVSALSNLTLSHGQTYYVAVKAVDNNGKESPVAVSDGWTVDTQAPNPIATFDDGSILDTLGASPWLNWSPTTDDDSGVAGYELAIGSSSGGNDVMDWTPLNDQTQAQITGLNLNDGATYYPQVRAVDVAGNKSSPTLGDGWTTAKPMSLLYTNGSVSQTLKVGNTLYLAGSFTSIAPKNEYIAQLNSDGSVDSAIDWPDFNGAISVMIPDGSGGYYVGGDFTQVNGLDRLGIAQVNSDGSLGSFTVSIGGSTSYLRRVNALLVDGDTLYIGGYFESINGVSRNSLGSVTISTATITSWDPNPKGSTYGAENKGLIQAFHVVGSDLFVGGRFLNIAGEARTHLASFNKSTGLLNANFAPTISHYFGDATVYVIKDSGGYIYFGGKITTVNSVTRKAAAAVSIADGSENSWNPVTSPSGANVSSILMDGANAYIAGDFWSPSGCTFCRNIAHVNLTTGASSAQGSGWMLNFYYGSFGIPDKPVLDMKLIGSTLYVATEKLSLPSRINSGTMCQLPNYYVHAINVSTGVTVNYFSGVDNEVRSLNVIGSDLLMGGAFRIAGGSVRSGMAAIDLTDGSLLPFDPKACDSSGNGIFVNSFAYDSGNIYMGGRFESVNGNTARVNLAKVNATTGVADPSWSADLTGGGGPGDIYKIRTVGSKLYVGGRITTIDSVSRNGIARFDLPGGVMDSWNPDVVANNIIHFVVDSGNVYLFGEISEAGGNPRMHAAAVLESDGSALAWDPQIQTGYRVWDAFIDSGKMYMGGQFSVIQGQNRSGLAVVDLATATLDSINYGTAMGNNVYKITPWTNNSKYVVVNSSNAKDFIFNLTTAEVYTGTVDFKGHIGIDGNTVYTGTNASSGFYFNPLDMFTGKRN